MSLFKSREWWSTNCGIDETFGDAHMCIAKYESAISGVVKQIIIVGSLEGYLRIYDPQPPSSLFFRGQRCRWRKKNSAHTLFVCLAFFLLASDQPRATFDEIIQQPGKKFVLLFCLISVLFTLLRLLNMFAQMLPPTGRAG